MIIRQYMASDIDEVAKIFYDTVHTINAKDYSQRQLDAWADGETDRIRLEKALNSHFTLVAMDDKGRITGFGDIDVKSGYLDHLYVHAEYQRRGIASQICEILEKSANSEEIITHASITARPFFEKRGYKVKKSQTVERKGVLLVNYLMVKGVSSR